MTGKRGRTDSTGPFYARKYAADLLSGDVDDPASFIEGRVFSTNPRKNMYTLDIRLDSRANATHLNVFIEEKLQKRLGELLVGDHLKISLRGAQLLPSPGSPLHVPVVLRFREGITVLLVSRAGLQGEKEKLFQVWPGPNAGKAKKRKQPLNVDNSDVDWFSTPHPGDSQPGVGGNLITQTIAAAGLGRTKSAAPPPPPASPSALTASRTSAGHSGATNDTGPSTSVVTPVVLSSSRIPPLTTGQSRGEATYAYKTTRPVEQSTPTHLTSLPEFPETANSFVPPTPAPSTSKQISARNSVPPSWSSLEPGSTSEGPPLPKIKSARKRKRDEAKRPAASAATVMPVTTTDTSPDPVKPIVPETVEDACVCDPPRYDGQTELDLDVPSIQVVRKPELSTFAQVRGEETRLIEDSIEQDQDDPALSMRAGLIVNGWPYTALSELRYAALMSIIGVVTSAKEPTQTHKGDWCTCFSLLDPSVLDSFGGVLYTSGGGIKINCFMRMEQLVPNPRQGDIVLLRQVKIGRWNDGFTGTCFANTMQWAIYDPLTEEVSQPDPNLASYRSHHPFSWPVVPQEREYCAQLAKWWAAVQRTRAERQGTAVQIGGGPVIAVERKNMQRQHLLISEADPGREPRGYFNCTVEILHGHANHVSDIYSIYVTDYTSKSGTSTEHGSDWCPATLADRVLRIEMWREKAVALAQQMNPGDYWYLDNVRMKVSNSGYIEGSFSEAVKARKLSTADVDANQHLRALLERKKVWEKIDMNPHVFPHKLFNEAVHHSIFDCTVEVLHAEYNAAGTSMLYITDFTERSDLATPPMALWSRGLEGRIVTLELQGQQSKMADRMEIGAFFTVKHMRLLERITGAGRVVGRVGGPDRLIHKLNANNPNQELENLLERKKRWKEGATPARPTDSFTTIAHVLKSDKRVDRFRIRARVVGTFPLRLDDCVVRCCPGCSEQLPSGTNTCTQCIASDGSTPECEHIFHLFFRIQDEHGQAQITVNVDQNSSMLGGFSPDELMSGSGMTGMVRKRLSRYIGNLEDVQDANSQGRTLVAKVPVCEFTIESWYVEGEEDESSGEPVVAYGLV